MNEHTVIFQPSGRRGKIKDGANLLEAARSLGVEIESICGEKKTCGKCKVQVEEGFFEKYGVDSRVGNLSGWTRDEERMLSLAEKENKYRLSCLAHVQGDLLVFVPEESRGGKQVVRKKAGKLKHKPDPALTIHYIEMQSPTLHDPEDDFLRVVAALKAQHGVEADRIDIHCLRAMTGTLRKADWKVTVFLLHGEIVRVAPGKVENYYGIAIDIGTTTVAAYLTDLKTGRAVATESKMNPQVIYGEDVMSRITYAMQNPETGLEKMHKAIIGTLNEMIGALAEEHMITRDDILEMVLVCNTAMHHILLRLDPQYVGVAPFPTAMSKALDVKARDLGIDINICGSIHVLANEAGFVGADNCGVLIAEEPYNSEELMLIIDIGTNGELLLGSKKHGVVSCSVATGPALEGAQIKFGMRAAPGAIEKVEIDQETLEPRFKVIGKELWNIDAAEIEAKGICGSGIIDVVSEMFRTGIIDKSGRFSKYAPSKRITKDPQSGMPEYILAYKEETSIGKDIVVTQGDVRAIQLAVGSIYAGAVIMMREHGVEKVDTVVLAGAFGSHLNQFSCLLMGMFPDAPLDKILSVGNAAGDGARLCLVNKHKRKEADEMARKVRYLELTVYKDFERVFMKSMQFPHMEDKFPTIQHVIDEIPDWKKIAREKEKAEQEGG
ncbi:MAG: ASKHA domain-containing protein [Nitrospinota bacterium]|nr:ASKHA domain-containing protein [Nitrospinota bacterium]MDH5755444.1 ASKHA domain-containing protein [Nitrospinota bacterium]